MAAVRWLPPAASRWPRSASCCSSTQLLARGMTSPLRAMTAAARAMAQRRLHATGPGHLARRGRRARRARSTRWPRTWRRRTGSAASWSPTCRTSCARRSPRCRRSWRTSSTGSAAPDPATLHDRAGPDRAARPAGRRAAGPVPARRRRRAMDPDDVAVGRAARGGGRGGRGRDRPPVRACGSRPTSRRRTCVAHGDRDRLHQVLLNLLDNAARHSPPGGAVSVVARTERRADCAWRSPTRGRASRPRTATGCSTASRAASARRGGGTGLGLAIARWAVDLHGGEIVAGPAGPAGPAEPGDPADVAAPGCRIRITLPGVVA